MFDYKKIPSYIANQLFSFQDANRLVENVRHLAENILNISEGANTGFSRLNLGNTDSVLMGSVDLETGTGSNEKFLARTNAPFGNILRTQGSVRWRMLGQTKTYGNQCLLSWHEQVNSIANSLIVNLLTHSTKSSLVGLSVTSITSVVGTNTQFYASVQSGSLFTPAVALGAVNNIIRHKATAARGAFLNQGVPGINLISLGNVTTGGGNLHYLYGSMTYVTEV